MILFQSDYNEGAHPRILKALVNTNLVQTYGYGEDQYSLEAIKLLKQRLNNQNVDIHFISGGTQTNLLASTAFLRPHEAIISASTAHIYEHECGAIEATGHKVIPILTVDGKLNANLLKENILKHQDPFDVKIKMVYISNVSELGTIYTKDELLAIKQVCNEFNLIFYMDGARLGSALTAKNNDLAFSDLCNIFDAFYIGGTKNGAMFGEALVIVNDDLKPDFRYLYKQRGAMFAKGRLLGIQFYELFKDKLFLDLASHANKMALQIKQVLIENDYEFITDSYSNLQFVIIPKEHFEMLSKKYGIDIIDKFDEEKIIVRFATSWATKQENVDALINDINLLNKKA